MDYFKVSCVNYSAFFLSRKTSSGRIEGYDGVAYELLKVFAEKLQFDYEVVVPADGTFGMLGEDGNWTGVVGTLQRNEVDFGMGLAPYPERTEVVDFSFPYVLSPFTFAIQKASETPKYFIYLSPFGTRVWLCLIFIFLFCSFAIGFVHNRGRKRRKKPLTCVDETLSAAMTISGSHGTKNMNKKSKIIIMVFKLMLIVLRSGFSGLLLSFLMSPIMERQVSSVNELVEASRRGRVKVLALEDSNVEYLLLKAAEEPFKSLGKYARKNPTDSFKAVADGFSRLKDGFVLLEEKDVLKLVMAEHPEGVFVSEDTIQSVPFTVGFKKNFTKKEGFDKLIIRIVQAGIYGKIANEYSYRRTLRDRLSQKAQAENTRPISLYDLSGVFFILVFGYVVSALILLFEIYSGKKSKARRKLSHIITERQNILQYSQYSSRTNLSPKIPPRK